jgi:hypothetical protein
MWKKRTISHRHGGLMALCGAILVVGNTSFAADDVANDPSAPSAVQASQDIDVMLRKVEQQISSGHTTSPAGDCATDTWKQVLRVIATADSPKASRSMAIFTTHMLDRAAEEMKAGNMTVANDFSVFAVQADGILVRSMAPTSDVAQSGARQSVAEGPPGNAGNAVPKIELLAGSLPPIPPPDARAAAPSTEPSDRPDTHQNSQIQDTSPITLAANAAPVLATPAPTTPQTSSAAEAYAVRGDQMLAIRDLSAARKFYEYAANAGSARAAKALVGTYDPAFLAQLGVLRQQNLGTRKQTPTSSVAAVAVTTVR